MQRIVYVVKMKKKDDIKLIAVHSVWKTREEADWQAALRNEYNNGYVYFVVNDNAKLVLGKFNGNEVLLSDGSGFFDLI